MMTVNRILLYALTIGLLFLGWRFTSTYQEMGATYFHVVMQSSADDVAKLYFDTGRGFSEKDSVGTRIYGNPHFHDYRFPLPRGEIKALRFDPLTSAGSVTLSSMEVLNGLGLRMRTMDFRQMKAAHQIRSIDIRDREATISTDDKADDPQVSIRFDSPLSPGYFGKASLLFYARMIGESLGLASLISGFLWVWFRWPDGASRTVMAIVLVVFGWRCWMLYQATTTSYLQAFLVSSVEGQSQLFYDKGRGFAEADSVKTKIWIDGRYFNYRFRLPQETLYRFRFDPFAAAGKMRFKDMEIVNGLGHPLRTIDLRQWLPANQIRELTFRNNELTMVTEEKVSDPQMVMTFLYPLKLDRTRSFLTLPLVSRGMMELIVITVLMLLLLSAVKRSDDPSAGRFGQSWLGAICLIACLYLIHVYSKGKWKDTVTFIQAWFKGC